MKKIISLFLALLAVACLFCACDGGGTSDQGDGDASAGGASSALGDYNVVIESSRLAEDYAGNPVIIVKYTFTNNSDEPTAFSWALDACAYQDGIGLTESYVLSDSAQYNSDDQIKEIKKGATLAVEVAYELNDTATDVEIEVSELISWSDKKITKVFHIK